MRLARSQDGVLDAITEALKQGDRVNVSGFGTFASSMRDARTGRNPQTGESIENLGQSVGQIQTRQADEGIDKRSACGERAGLKRRRAIVARDGQQNTQWRGARYG
jgi:nucleoid DNA-binding protein